MMAKQTKSPAKEEVTTLQPTSITPVEDPGKNSIDRVKLNFGEVLVASVNAEGVEGIPFKVSYSTYQKYFSNDKYILKKKQ